MRLRPLLALSLAFGLACFGGKDAPDDGITTDDTSPSGDDTAATDDSEGPPPLGGEVLVFEGGGGMSSNSGAYLINGIDDLIDTWEGLGHPVTVSSDWPSDPTPFGLVIWYLPGSDDDGRDQPSPDLLDDLEDWLHRGGRLVMAGDANTSYGGYSLQTGNDTIDRIAAGWGLPMALNADVPGDRACAPSGHPLMDGVSGISWYASNSLEVAAPAQWLACDALAVASVGCGEVVIIGDVNPVSDGPSRSNGFVDNLVTVPTVGDCG